MGIPQDVRVTASCVELPSDIRLKKGIDLLADGAELELRGRAMNFGFPTRKRVEVTDVQELERYVCVVSYTVHETFHGAIETRILCFFHNSTLRGGLKKASGGHTICIVDMERAGCAIHSFFGMDDVCGLPPL